MNGRVRTRGLTARLGPRDSAILRSLLEFRLMSGAQLRRLHFPGTSIPTQSRKARAALQRLTELGAVVRLRRRVGGIRAGSEGHVYGLSGLGFAVLNPEATQRYRRVPETKLAYAAHVLAVSELGVTLHERARAGRCVLSEFRAEPGCWRWFDGIGGRRALKPDAYARLDVEGYELSAFIEQDMDTESLPIIRRKLDLYVDYWRTGAEQDQHGVFPRVWWLVPDEHRLTAITNTIRQVSTDARDLFTVALTPEAADQLTRLPQLEGGPQ